MKSISRKQLWTSIIGAGVVGGGLLMAGSTLAASGVATPASLVQELANKFHLDASQVQAVVDNHRTEMQNYREANYEQRLNAAVTSGQLTQAQHDAILAEHNKLVGELQAAMKNTDQTARRAAIKQVRQEGADWAKANNVAVKWLVLGRAGRF